MAFPSSYVLYIRTNENTHKQRSPAERPRERGETHLTLLYRWPGDNNPKTPPLPPPQRFLSLSLPVQEASKMRASLGKALYREKKREEPPHGGMRKRELCFRGTPWLAGQNSPRTQRATCQNSRLPARLPDPFHRVELLTCASFAIYRCSLDFCAGLQAASRIVKDYARAIFFLSLSRCYAFEGSRLTSLGGARGPVWCRCGFESQARRRRWRDAANIYTQTVVRERDGDL